MRRGAILLFCITCVLKLVSIIRPAQFDYVRDRPTNEEIMQIFGPSLHPLRPNKKNSPDDKTPGCTGNPGKDATFDVLSNRYHELPFRSEIKLTDLIYNESLGLYAFNGFMPVVWSFWDGSPMPPFIRLGILTWKCHMGLMNHHVAVLDSKQAATLLENRLNPMFDYLSYNHKADYIRCKLLEKFGGIWLDADTLAMDTAAGQTSYLLRECGQFDIVAYTWEPQNSSIGMGILGPMRAHSQLMQFWRNVTVLKLTQSLQKATKYGKDPFGWTELLGDVLVPVFHKMMQFNLINYKLVRGPWTYGQLELVYNNPAFKPYCQLPAEKLQLNATPYLMYFNSQLSNQSPLRTMSVKDFLDQKLVFNMLISRSLEKCSTVHRGKIPCEISRVLEYIRSKQNYLFQCPGMSYTYNSRQ